MRFSRRHARALVSTVATATVLGAGALAAGPAHATVSDVDSGGPLTRSMIVERAYSWATAQVPYSQSSYYPSSAPRTGAGHGYRQDCSGFVSMAWDLRGSAVTGDLVTNSSAYDTPLGSWSQLQPGDLLGVSTHTVLFLGWSADDAGRHRYFDLAAESTSAHPAAVALDQDAQGYWASYAPYRYKHVVDDLPSAVSWGGGRVDSVVLDANGHVLHTIRFPTAPAVTEDLTAAHGFPIMRTAPSIASQGSGLLDIVGTGTGGALIEYDYTRGWSTHTLAPAGTVYGISLTGMSGRLDLYGRQPGNDGADALLHATVVGGVLSSWTPVGNPPAVADDPSIVRVSGTEIDAVDEAADGSLLLGRWNDAGWAWTTPFGATHTTLRPQIARLTDATLVVTVTVAAAFQQATLRPGASAWTGFAPVTAAAVTGLPRAATASAVRGRFTWYAGRDR